MSRFPRLLFLFLPLAAVAAHSAGLPDTGQDFCYNDTVADGVLAADLESIARDNGTHPRQDCRYGRDPAAAAGTLTKAGAGAKGADYTKIANNGSSLAAGTTLGTAASDWACTRDNITGLTWEVKSTSPGDLRYFDHLYSWFSSDASTNGGNAGSAGSNTCNATLPGGLCNTQALITAINLGAGLCGQNDWRLPTLRELLTLVKVGGGGPTVAPTYFPNTVTSGFWSGSTFAVVPANAWYVLFIDGTTGRAGKSSNGHVRLVRGGQL